MYENESIKNKIQTPQEEQVGFRVKHVVSVATFCCEANFCMKVEFETSMIYSIAYCIWKQFKFDIHEEENMKGLLDLCVISSVRQLHFANSFYCLYKIEHSVRR